MANINHSQVAEGSRHPPHNLTYPDAANRIAGTNEGKGITVDSDNLWDFAKQDDDDSLYMLVSLAPLTWVQIMTAGIITTTLNDAYSNESGTHTITMNDGKIVWAGNTTSDIEYDMSGLNDGDFYGFKLLNGADYVKFLKTGTDEILVDVEAGEVVIDASGDIVLDTAGSLGVGTTDLDGTPEAGRLVVKASTNDGSTNCLVLRDSDEANIATWDSSGMIEMFGPAGSDIGLLDITISSNSIFTWASSQIAPNLTTGRNVVSFIGKAKNSKNSGYVGFYYDSNNSDDNCLSMGLYAVDNILNVTGAGNVGVGTLTPVSRLDVNGTITAGTSATDYVSFEHDGTDFKTEIGEGLQVVQHLQPVGLADDAFFDLPTRTTGHAFFTIMSITGGLLEYADVVFSGSAAEVTLANASANVKKTDDNGFFCVFDNSSTIRVRNRLGQPVVIVGNYNYAYFPPI